MSSPKPSRDLQGQPPQSPERGKAKQFPVCWANFCPGSLHPRWATHEAEAALLQPPRDTAETVPGLSGPSLKLQTHLLSKHTAWSGTSPLTHLASAAQRCQESQCKKTGWIQKVDTSHLPSLIKYLYNLLQNAKLTHETKTLSTRWVCGFFSPVYLNHLKAVIWKLDQAKLSYTNSNYHENQQIFGILPCLYSVNSGGWARQ